MTTPTWLVGYLTGFFSGWLICGILAYGVIKNNIRQSFSTEWRNLRYNNLAELICFLFFLAGSVGLVLAVIFTELDGHKLGLCYRMPKEIYEPRGVEE